MSSFKHVVPIFISTFVFCEGCPSGWIQLDESCYLFAKLTDTWAEAQSICLAMHGKLAEPRTQAEVEFIASEIRTLRNTYWIGINDIAVENRWEYTSDDSVLAVTWWGPNEPNGRDGENCAAATNVYAGKWADFACKTPMHFICEKPAKVNGGSIIG